MCYKIHFHFPYFSVFLVEAASEVLKQILSTRTGISFSNDYKVKVNDNLFYFLHPFKTSKKKVKLPSMLKNTRIFVWPGCDSSFYFSAMESVMKKDINTIYIHFFIRNVSIAYCRTFLKLRSFYVNFHYILYICSYSPLMNVYLPYLGNGSA